MRLFNTTLIILLIIINIGCLNVTGQIPGNIKLPKNYKYKPINSDDTIVGEIHKKKGPTILFEISPCENKIPNSKGIIEDPIDTYNFIWYEEKIINGKLFIYSLTKELVLNVIVYNSSSGYIGRCAKFTGYAENIIEAKEILNIIFTFDFNAVP